MPKMPVTQRSTLRSPEGFPNASSHLSETRRSPFRGIKGALADSSSPAARVFNRRVLEAIDLGAVHADGYGFQIELTYRAIQAGFTVTEVPILFRERREGQSKMTARIALEAVWKVPALRFRG